MRRTSWISLRRSWTRCLGSSSGTSRKRPRAGFWVANGDPERLRAEALRSCEKLGVEQIALWQLHRVDPKVPREAQFAAVRALIDDGIVRHVGLSEASVEDIEAAQDVFPVATVQNLYNLVNRRSQDVLDYCEAKSIGFIPWYPLANGKLAREGSILDAVARAHDASPSQIALATPDEKLKRHGQAIAAASIPQGAR